MPSTVAAMSGSGPQEIVVTQNYVGYDQGGNYSTWYWEVVYRNNGGGHWSSDPTHHWRASSPYFDTGDVYFGIPSSWAGSGDHVLGSGYYTRGHVPAGYSGSVTVDANIITTHSGIGSGYASVGSGDAPRIPKPPVATYWPLDPPIDQITTTSFRVRFGFWPGDDGGMPVTQYQVETTRAGDLLVQNFYFGNGSNGQEVIQPLQPGTLHTVRTRVRNDIGWGPWSTVKSATTLAGIFVSDGENWVACPMLCSDGAAWASLVPSVSTGSAWVQPS